MGDKKTIQELACAGSGVIDLLPQEMERVTLEDAEYHAAVSDEWIALNQVETLRNRRFHDHAIDQIASGLSADAVILELGAGVGYDARKFLTRGVPFGTYIVSEISAGLLEFSKRYLGSVAAGKNVRYCCLDASCILLADRQVDRILTIAALHHFPHLDRALAEIDRICKPDASIVFAIEPNRLWSAILVGLRPLYRRLFASKSHSAADEEAEGFRVKDFHEMGARQRWIVESVKPVWFFAGFLHLGLEALYRLLRLKNRIQIPVPLEGFVLLLDSLFFKLPLANRLAWHYTVVFRKPAEQQAR